ncbi:hypothetical protein PMAYCL1PPCAC_00261 [Pristionchus mayeri]|uniref:Uncharacterized protein n=1 Tax=Pristionchus mayeri TaxID=1317129 RepID=A0AAN5C691_9BILA|nr:hypothetical protein PMAYCL1PPCAC_00261 [Pristionchus mayeri]
MCFRSFAILCMLALALDAELQTITVTGITVCHRRRVADVRIELWERDTMDADDLLLEVRSNATGDFTMTGSQDEYGSIAPYIIIYHECDAKPNCQRVAEYDVPADKIGSTYDMTYISMNIFVKGEKDQCP